MKIYVIRNSEDNSLKDLGYLFYFTENMFYIELPKDINEWETPLILSSFVKKKKYTVGAYFTELWVQQRIIPIDRQNLGQILKDNNLKEYDEFQLLVLANGRCAQDEYYITEISEDELPLEIKERLKNGKRFIPVLNNE